MVVDLDVLVLLEVVEKDVEVDHVTGRLSCPTQLQFARQGWILTAVEGLTNQVQ